MADRQALPGTLAMSYRIHFNESLADAVPRIVCEQMERAVAVLTVPDPDVTQAIHQVRKRCKKIRGLLRLVYGRDEVVVVLVTYATFLILEDVIVLIWGPRSYAAWQPMVAAGSIEVGRLILSNYDIILVGIAAGLAALAYWSLRFTRYGRLLTAVIFDRETAAAFGVNVTLVYTATFLIGAMLGALGGAVMAPKISVTLGIGVEVIVLAFAVVAIGGMGSIEGALIGALIVGICRAAAVHLVPQIELFVIYGVMALVLAVRPYGLFVRAQPRKI